MHGIGLNFVLMHAHRYPMPYLTAAAAIGTTEAEVQQFIAKMEACYTKMLKQTAVAPAAGDRS